jgi:cell division protein FtsB
MRSVASEEPGAGPARGPARVRELWSSRMIRIVTTVVGLGAAVILLVMLVFPTQAYLEQRRRIDEAEATLAALRTETAELEREVASGTDPIELERIAREQLSLVRDGDRLYRLSVDPGDAVDLPPGWPLPGVRHLLTGD